MRKTKFATLDKCALKPNGISLFEYKGCLYAHITNKQDHQLREYNAKGEPLRVSKTMPLNKLVTLAREDKWAMAATTCFEQNESFGFPMPINEPFIVERFINWKGNI